MFKKLLIILSLLLLILGCRKKDDLVIEDADEKREIVEVKDDILESKPLIEVSKDDTIYILVRSDGYPGMWLGDDGEVYGFFIDLEKMVMSEMGQKYEFKPYTDIGSAAQDLKTGVSHIALAVPDIPDYRNFLNLTIPYETYNYVTFVRINNNDITGNTKEDVIKSLHGKRVGVQVTGFVYQNLRNIKEIELIEFPTTTQAMEGLDQGLVDAVLENRETAKYYIELNDWNLKSVGPNIINHKNTTGFSKIYDISVVDRYNRALKKLLDDGSVYQLHREYYGDIAEEYRP